VFRNAKLFDAGQTDQQAQRGPSVYATTMKTTTGRLPAAMLMRLSASGACCDG
jgi:hypothetical protein